jgi:DNA-binding transcriptional MerR regulator
MTHFTVGIIVPQGLNDVESFIAEQMEPYCENTEVKPYVYYSLEEAAGDIQRDIERLEQILRRQDPDYNLDKCRDILAKLRRTTPEQKYAEYVRFHEDFDDQSRPISTYNPDSKWDWYVIGGRWDGWINDKETSRESVTDNTATTEEAIARGRIPHAIITPDGQWHERGQMGWWAMLLTENEDWTSDAKALLASYPCHRLVIVDAHI